MRSLICIFCVLCCRGIVRLQFVWAYYDWESLDTSMAVPRVGGVGGAGGGGGGGATPIRINNPLPGSSYPTAPGQVGGAERVGRGSERSGRVM